MCLREKEKKKIVPIIIHRNINNNLVFVLFICFSHFFRLHYRFKAVVSSVLLLYDVLPGPFIFSARCFMLFDPSERKKKKRRYKIWAEEEKKHTLTHTIAVNQEDRAPSSVLRELCL